MANSGLRDPHVRGPILRLLSGVVAFWLLAMPQVMFSRTMVAFYSEVGAAPSPILEEEVKHACAPLASPALFTAIAAEEDEDEMPRLDERVEAAPHGDVASPPPKVIIG